MGLLMQEAGCRVLEVLLLMDKILHDPKDPKLWELWYIPYNGYCRILSINRIKPKFNPLVILGRLSQPLKGKAQASTYS